MRSFRDFNPYIVGIVTVTLIGAATAAAFSVGILHLLEDTYSVTAVFADSAGISAGDDVRVAGVKVGRVGSVKADREHGNVRIELIVNDGIELGSETSAEVALQTLLGTKFVRLAGTVREPYLEDGAQIPLERTRIPFDIFELAKVGTRSIQATDTERLNLFVDQLATLAAGRRNDLRRLFRGVERVGTQLSDREAELHSLFDRVETIAATLDEKDQVLVRLLEQSAGVLDVIQARRVQLAEGLGATDLLTAQLADLVTEHKAALDQVLDTLHPTVDILDRRQRDLDRALAWIGPGTLGLAQAVNHGDWADVFAVFGDEDPTDR